MNISSQSASCPFVSDAEKYTSINYIRIEFLNFGLCHPIFYTCGPSPHEVMKAKIQGRLISGRYRFERLQRHFGDRGLERNAAAKAGLCSLQSCQSPETRHIGDIESFFLSCKSLIPARSQFGMFMMMYLAEFPHLTGLIDECLNTSPIQFYLDCSTLPCVIEAKQTFGDIILCQLFRMTRHYCFLLHKLRMSLISELNL